MSEDRITIGHGAGGRLSRRLVTDLFARHFGNEALAPLDDAAAVGAAGELAFTTDAYVVKPLFFPGGDIGKLAVCGTINDLAVMGATPRWLSAAFILEEGLEVAVLEQVAASAAAAAREAGVAVVCGDTKVVARGEADGLFIATAGVGLFEGGRPARAPLAPGDKVLVSGTVGDHGIAVMIARHQLHMDAAVASDCAPLHSLCAAVRAAAPGVKFMRDATRGGLAAVLNEIAAGAGLGLAIDEGAIPVREGVRAVCEILGFDPFFIANEGKVVVVAAAAEADAALAALRAHALGREAALIGEVTAAPARVQARTAVGGTRIIEMPLADQLPRIC